MYNCTTSLHAHINHVPVYGLSTFINGCCNMNGCCVFPQHFLAYASAQGLSPLHPGCCAFLQAAFIFLCWSPTQSGNTFSRMPGCQVP